MAKGTDFRAPPSAQPANTVAPVAGTVDGAFRSYLLSVYNYMAAGVALTGAVALVFANSGYAATILGGPGLLKYAIIFAPLVFVMVMSIGLNRLSTATLQLLFWAFAAVMGLSLASIFLIFTGQSIAATFFATAGAFAGLSLWGYTTKKDLSGLGTLFVMGLFGLIIAMLINLFLQSSALQFAVSIIGVLLFAGLTAYDTQRIKNLYFRVETTEMRGKTAIMGALTLYLDFINLFTFLLNFMGNRR